MIHFNSSIRSDGVEINPSLVPMLKHVHTRPHNYCMQFSLIRQKVSGVLANISAVRRSKGYSEEYMADIMNIPRRTYTGIENGSIALTLQNTVEIALIFQIDIKSLFLLDLPKLPILHLVR